jgi:type IV secretion system protein VirB10
MTLSSPLHTTSAEKGSGVYRVTTWPVVENDMVVIPACTRVMGVVEQDRRPGRVKGRAQFRFRFTSLILPNDHVVKIQGGLQSLPDGKNRTRDAEGTIEPVGQIDRDVYTVAKGVAAGGLAGAITRNGPAAGIGMGVGGGLALAKVLFTRGDEIHLRQGTKVEMVLQRSVVIDRQ